MRIKSLSHVGITVSNFEKSVKWYWDVFRFPLISESTIDADTVEKLNKLYNLEKGVSIRLGFLRLPKGGVIEIFEFNKLEKFNHCWNRIGTTHFTIDVNCIDKWFKKLSSRTDVTILSEPTKTDGSDWFFFRDPDGNLIELIDHHFNYFAIHVLGKIAGFFMRKTKFKKYYR